MSADLPGRTPRAFFVVAGRAAVLQVEARPGHLRSWAPPPADWVPPTHPFIDASSLDPTTEDRLRTILLASATFDDFLARLVGAGFDLLSAPNDTWQLEPARRIRDERGRVVGALWPRAGQSSGLVWQPSGEDLVFAHATVTVYAADALDAIHGALAVTASVAELERVLQGFGFTLAPAS